MAEEREPQYPGGHPGQHPAERPQPGLRGGEPAPGQPGSRAGQKQYRVQPGRTFKGQPAGKVVTATDEEYKAAPADLWPLRPGEEGYIEPPQPTTKR